MSEIDDFLFEVAGDYFVGDDDEVGRRGRRRRRARRAARRARRSARRHPALKAPFSPDATRIKTLPLGSTSIAQAANATTPTAGRLAVVMQRAAQFSRLSLSAFDPGATLPVEAAETAVLVSDIKLGTVSQLAGIDSLPLAVFGSRATASTIETGVARTGITVSVDLLNTYTGGAIVCSGAFIGVVAD